MRILVLGTAVCQIYDQVTVGDVLEAHETARLIEEIPRRHVISQGDSKKSISAPTTPTIRPPEFVSGSAFQYSQELQASPPDTPSASAALNSNTIAPAISAEEGLQFLHKLVTQGAVQAEKLSKAFISEFATAASKRESFLSDKSASTSENILQSRPRPGPSLQQQQFAQTAMPSYWSPALSQGLTSALVEESPVWPWWRSTTMFNEALTRSAIDILTSMGYSSQVAIDGWFNLANDWSKVMNTIADMQQRFNQAMWKFQGWTLRLLIPADDVVLGPSTPAQVLKPNLVESAELLASSAQLASAEEYESEVVESAYEPSLEFLPLELSSYARH